MSRVAEVVFTLETWAALERRAETRRALVLLEGERMAHARDVDRSQGYSAVVLGPAETRAAEAAARVRTEAVLVTALQEVKAAIEGLEKRCEELERRLSRKFSPMKERKWGRRTIREWAKEGGLPWGTLYWRLTHGWSLQRALKTPVRAWVPLEKRAS